jgi:hypothetical protein
MFHVVASHVMIPSCMLEVNLFFLSVFFFKKLDIIRFCAVNAIHVFITNKCHQFKYAGLLLWHVSAVESSHPHRMHYTKEVSLFLVYGNSFGSDNCMFVKCNSRRWLLSIADTYQNNSPVYFDWCSLLVIIFSVSCIFTLEATQVTLIYVLRSTKFSTQTSLV